MPDQFHPHLTVSSTREDLGIIRPRRAADSENTLVARPDLLSVLDTESHTVQFSSDDLRHGDDAATPVELFGERFATIEMPKDPIMRLGFLAVTVCGIRRSI